MSAHKSSSIQITKVVATVMAAGLFAGVTANAQAQDAPQVTWNAAIAHTPVPHAGCFTAEFPSTTWKEVKCQAAPAVPFVPATGNGGRQTVGDGNDYSAEVSGTLITSSVGSFPTVKNLSTEEDGGKSNYYSLQANSNFMSGSPACSGASNPANCLAWEQFVYSSVPSAGFMQYWLINYGNTCPSGWAAFGSDCYVNSSAVHVPQQTIKQLKNITLSGAAVAGGIDTLVMTTKTAAYSTTGQDSMVYLANGWTATEFNVIGDGGGSEAVFNTGTKLKVQIDLVDGQTTAPSCTPHSGTTGETNNLNLGKCTTTSGVTPSVSFVESN